MNILVTGGAGFIGSSIVDSLIELNKNVVIIDNLSTGKKSFINPAAKFYKMNINSPRVREILNKENITHIIHQAAQIDVNRSLKEPCFDVENNIKGTVNLLEACREQGVDKFIYASSAAVYGDPEYLPVDEKHPIAAMSPYGISKHTPEHYIKMYGDLYRINYTILRYANVYGPRQDPLGEGGVISIFTAQMLAGKRPVIYGDGEQTRDFVFVEDIVEANIRSLTAADNTLFNVSTCTRTSINELFTTIKKILAADIDPVYEEERQGDIKHSCLANNVIKEVFDWTPEYQLKEGLSRTIAYYARSRKIEEVAAGVEEK